MSSFLSRWAESIETGNEEPVLSTKGTADPAPSSPPPMPAGNGGQPWCEWKAQSLNEEFRRLTGVRGRITAATVRHGERSRRMIAAAMMHLASVEPANGYTACGHISAPGYATFDPARVDCPDCRRALKHRRNGEGK